MALRRFHPTSSVRSSGSVEDPSDVSRCLSCGGEVAPLLSRTGSVRCHDCRDADAPVLPELVEPETPAESLEAA